MSPKVHSKNLYGTNDIFKITNDLKTLSNVIANDLKTLANVRENFIIRNEIEKKINFSL